MMLASAYATRMPGWNNDISSCKFARDVCMWCLCHTLPEKTLLFSFSGTGEVIIDSIYI